MRVRHIEQAVRGIEALDPQHRAGLEMVEWRIGRLRHLIWTSYHQVAHDDLFAMRHMASEVAHLNGEKFRPAVARLLWNCDDLRRYLANNTGSLIDYGTPHRSKLPISTSWAEGCVDEIANARMAKKQRMMVAAGSPPRRRRPHPCIGRPPQPTNGSPSGSPTDQDLSTPPSRSSAAATANLASRSCPVVEWSSAPLAG
jgi:hypothetical protein